jgi:hypothetical protein
MSVSVSVQSFMMGPRYTVSQRSYCRACIEMFVSFCPYYRQDDPRTACAMNMFFRDALHVYAAIPYKDFHEYLVRRFQAWYTTFKPKSVAVDVGVEGAEVGDVMEVPGAEGAKRARYRST